MSSEPKPTTSQRKETEPKQTTSQRRKDTRDDFKDSVKNILRQRAGDKCCLCGTPTSGPSNDPEKAHNIGQAAHITAASKGGPRYDETLTTEQRSSPENGIWLCGNCHTIVDGDKEGKVYTVEILEQHKKECEEQARKAFGAPQPNISKLTSETQSAGASLLTAHQAFILVRGRGGTK